MKRVLATALGISAISSAAFAGPDCSEMSHDMPMWEVVKAFEEADGIVKLAKVTSGNCYELYGTVDGQKFEIYFSPTSGEEIERNEG